MLSSEVSLDSPDMARVTAPEIGLLCELRALGERGPKGAESVTSVVQGWGVVHACLVRVGT